MRRRGRLIAAIVAIVVGLVLVWIAAFGSRSNQTAQNTLPEAQATPGTIAPLDPDARRSPNTVDGTATPKDEPSPTDTPGDIFDQEYGARGKHEVTVSIRASGKFKYQVKWRDGKADEGISSGYHRTRTLTGGFPFAQVVAIVVPQDNVSCTITVDGVEKDSASRSHTFRPAICTG